ncbi:SMC-Scp complex subunit ScpB, partial [bacterium]
LNTDAKEENKYKKDEVLAIIDSLTEKYKDDAFPWQLINVAGGYQFVTKKEFSGWIKKLYKSKFTIRLSASALETLSIIAYKQPITKAEVEQIRGVDSTGVLGTLLNRTLIKIGGRKEALGNPALYVTTQEFLKYFGLNDVNELPLPEHIELSEEDLKEIESFDRANEQGDTADVSLIENEDYKESEQKQEVEQEEQHQQEEIEIETKK